MSTKRAHTDRIGLLLSPSEVKRFRNRVCVCVCVREIFMEPLPCAGHSPSLGRCLFLKPDPSISLFVLEGWEMIPMEPLIYLTDVLQFCVSPPLGSRMESAVPSLHQEQIISASSSCQATFSSLNLQHLEAM